MTQLTTPPRLDMTMRSAQTAKKYMGNPFWVFAAFVKKIQGISVAFLPFLPFFGLYFGILSSAQNIGAWGYGANGIVFWVGYGVSIFAVYLLGNAFSGDSKVTEVTIGDAFVPLLVLLPMVFLPPAWGIIATVLVFGAIYLGARVILRDWREANNYVIAIGIFFLTVWLMAGITAYVAKGLGSQGWGLGSINIPEENRKADLEWEKAERDRLCRQGKKEYCGPAKPQIPTDVVIPGYSGERLAGLLDQMCGASLAGELPAGLSQTIGPVVKQYKTELDQYCRELKAYQDYGGQDTAPASSAPEGLGEAEWQSVKEYYCQTGGVPKGYERWLSQLSPSMCPGGKTVGRPTVNPNARPTFTPIPGNGEGTKAPAQQTPGAAAKSPTPVLTTADCKKKYGDRWYWNGTECVR